MSVQLLNRKHRFEDGMPVDAKALGNELDQIYRFINKEVVKIDRSKDISDDNKSPIKIIYPKGIDDPTEPGGKLPIKDPRVAVGRSVEGLAEENIYPQIKSGKLVTQANASTSNGLILLKAPVGYTVERIGWTISEAFPNHSLTVKIGALELITVDDIDLGSTYSNEKYIDYEILAQDDIVAKITGAATATGKIKVNVTLVKKYES